MQKSFKFFNRPILGWIGAIGTTIILALGEWVIIDLHIENPNQGWGNDIILFIILWMLIIFVMVITCFKRIVINDIGITQTTLWFFKRRMPWDEIKEMRYVVVMGAESIVFSKEPSTDLSPFQARERKGIIQLEPSKKTLTAIREFTDMEIVGLTKENEELIKSQKVRWV